MKNKNIIQLSDKCEQQKKEKTFAFYLHVCLFHFIKTKIENVCVCVNLIIDDICITLWLVL